MIIVQSQRVGMLHPAKKDEKGILVADSTFIDDHDKLKLTVAYLVTTDRNFDEILRFFSADR